MAKAKPKSDGPAKYQRAIKQLAEVVAQWMKEDGRPLDDYLTQVAEDLETIVNGGAR